MNKGRGKVEATLLRVLLALEMSDRSQRDKERGFTTNDLAARVFCGDDFPDLAAKAGGKVAVTGAQRASASRALNRLAAEGMVRRAETYKAPNGEMLWQIHPRVVIR
jgi:hypothetical protein